MAWQYHTEAKRKARVLERQRDALSAMKTTREVDSMERKQMEAKALEQSTDDRRGDCRRRPITSYPVVTAQQMERHLHSQAKELRNHNMYMGPMAAFDDYFNPTTMRTFDDDHRKYY